MRLTIRHLSTYLYDPPADRVAMRLKLYPSRFEGQSTVEWRVTVNGVVVKSVVFGVLASGFGLLKEPLTTETWTGAAGITIWSKFMLDFMLSRHAHPMQWGRKKPDAEKAEEGGGADEAGVKTD